MQIIMIIIQFILSFFSIFIDTKHSKKPILLILLLLIVCSACAAIYSSLQSKKEHQTELIEQNNARSKLEKSYYLIDSSNRHLVSQLDTLIRGFGFNKSKMTITDIDRSVKADGVLRELQTTSITNKGITVQYFRKDIDADIVAQVLRNLGFNPLIEPPVNDYATNALWVGYKVTTEDAQKVALSLVRAGVGLRLIARFEVDEAATANLIQVGSDPNCISKPIMTVSDIIKIKKI